MKQKLTNNPSSSGYHEIGAHGPFPFTCTSFPWEGHNHLLTTDWPSPFTLTCLLFHSQLPSPSSIPRTDSRLSSPRDLHALLIINMRLDLSTGRFFLSVKVAKDLCRPACNKAVSGLTICSI